MEIFFIILGIIILSLGVAIIFTSDDSGGIIIGVLAAIVGILIIVFFRFISINTIEEEITIKCLKGNNSYKMEIQYELKDSVYIPVDTIYVKIAR